MKKKNLSVEELKDIIDRFNNEPDINRKYQILELEPGKKALYIIKQMTLPLVEHASEETLDDVWKLVKKLATFTCAPVTLAHYKRMAVYAEKDAVVDVVLDTLKDMGYPFKPTDFIPDIVGYYYCIALISQSMHRREETIQLLNELVDYMLTNYFSDALCLARNMEVLSKEYPDLTNLFAKAKILYKVVATEDLKKDVVITINKLYPNYKSEDQIEKEYLNVENPQDNKIFVAVTEEDFTAGVIEKGKNIFNRKFKHNEYRSMEYAIVRDVLLRKQMEDLQIDDVNDTRVVEAMKTDLWKLYNDIAIAVYSKELKYIKDGDVPKSK